MDPATGIRKDGERGDCSSGVTQDCPAVSRDEPRSSVAQRDMGTVLEGRGGEGDNLALRSRGQLSWGRRPSTSIRRIPPTCRSKLGCIMNMTNPVTTFCRNCYCGRRADSITVTCVGNSSCMCMLSAFTYSPARVTDTTFRMFITQVRLTSIFRTDKSTPSHSACQHTKKRHLSTASRCSRLDCKQAQVWKGREIVTHSRD